MVIPPSPGITPKINPSSVPPTRNPTDGQDKICTKEPQKESIRYPSSMIPRNGATGMSARLLNLYWRSVSLGLRASHECSRQAAALVLSFRDRLAMKSHGEFSSRLRQSSGYP